MNAPVLSYFSGAGFLDIGLARSGLRPVWTNEYNDDIADLHDHAVTTSDTLDADPITSRRDIRTLDPADVLDEAFDGLQPPEIFGIIGGPPCPDFSVMGNNAGADGEKGQLAGTFIDHINRLEPTFFLFENVPGLINTKKHAVYFRELLDKLNRKYVTHHDILNALEFSVPQNRRRLFCFGVNREFLDANGQLDALTRWEDWIDLRSQSVHDNPLEEYDWPTTSPFGQTPDRPDVPDDLIVDPILDPESLEGVGNATDYFTPRSDKMTEIPEGDTAGQSMKRLHRYRFSPTACYGHNEVHLHPYEPRRLSVREALRIQSVPDYYEFPDTAALSHKFTAVGNGVPVRMAEGIGQAVTACLEGLKAGNYSLPDKDAQGRLSF